MCNVPNQPQANVSVQVVDTAEQRALCLAVRYEVFVDEQQVPLEEELDSYDDTAVHFLAMTVDGTEPVGTARLIILDEHKAKVGRVAVRTTFRRQRIGKAIMDEVESVAESRGVSVLVLDAQLHAIPFYEALGYRAFGPVFLDAGIEHRKMEKLLKTTGS